MNVTPLYEEVVLSGRNAADGKHWAFKMTVYSADGKVYGRVQKGKLSSGEFNPFGAPQRAKPYPTETAAIRAARDVIRTRVAAL